ncbi:MAG: diguanylate cyclase [Devosia sp.]|uniref:diguanylate cyclase domain-containing protein n=1 Tax=Devosia sp. TaxID=1871048 RepID=UPI00263370C1|nr:diguanylate cyclase [Devosia sp.]MDB5529356.1 diguanylate cyclase [Devosia sp.]
MPAAASAQMAPAPFQNPSRVGRTAGGLASLLESIRQRLDVDFATLRLIQGDQLVLAGSAGAPSPALENESRFSSRALIAPLVVPDTALDARFRDRTTIRFYAGIPLVTASGRTVGLLSLFDRSPRPLQLAARLAVLAANAMRSVEEAPSQERLIATLKGQLADQARLIHEQAAALDHSRLIFERAAATARIGVWECDLATEELTWTDGVYDLFELPRGSSIDRATTLLCYAPTSRALLEKLRTQAVTQGIGFTLDAEITTAKGNRRWMRLTTSVETENGVATRLFGMKQDITEEKILADRTRYLAEFDVMTGLANRSRFQSRLADQTQAIGALLLVDLDGFKSINDTFGHALGDECLKETALRLEAVGIEAELVARIGGDEFAVLLGPQTDYTAAEHLAGQIVEILGRPVTRGDQVLQLGASVGIALAMPEASPDQLFKQADTALYAAKAAGRKTFRLFSPAER